MPENAGGEPWRKSLMISISFPTLRKIYGLAGKFYVWKFIHAE
jgi:hypothetical protein